MDLLIKSLVLKTINLLTSLSSTFQLEIGTFMFIMGMYGWQIFQKDKTVNSVYEYH